MFLIINTTDGNFVELILANNQEVFKVKTSPAAYHQAEKLLKMVEDFLRLEKVALTELTAIGVVNGPGGYTSLRIGVIAANTLAYALKIKTVGISLNEFKGNNQLVKKVIEKFQLVAKNEFVLAHNIILPEYKDTKGV
ncbi:MAG: tRNA (adenosine(37)-N6)-threonylcarbamoyltransferase complex dimerization subunit type 1 TsaB [bacterium]